MLNKRIRSLIDDVFSDMKMTAENLALRDELMANAQSRFEDALAGGKSEEEAFAEVAGSLGDVRSLLQQMNGAEEAPKAKNESQSETANENAAQSKTCKQPPRAQSGGLQDLGSILNKAFGALNDLGSRLIPQQKKPAAPAEGAKDEVKDAPVPQSASPEQLRAEAQNLRAQAALKQASGDPDGARAMCEQAQMLETRAEIALQAEAIEQAAREATGSQSQSADAESAGDAAGNTESPAKASDAPHTSDESEAPDASVQDGAGNAQSTPDGGEFAKTVDDILRDAQKVVMKTGETLGEMGSEAVRMAKQAVHGEENHTVIAGESRFPAAGLRTVDVKVDADDVAVEAWPGEDILVCWSQMHEGSCPSVTMDGHTLSVRRSNPDVFKTFFSVFTKDGGKIVVRMPHGYAADYALSTTSGDIRLTGIDADTVKVNTTSGDVRLESDTASRVKEIGVNTVSGDTTVSACAEDIAVKTVSGDVFVSSDARRVDIDACSGDVHAEGASNEWEISTVSGDAQLLCTVVPSAKIQLSTVSGDVNVALPADVRGFVAELSGMGGHIVNEFGPNRYGTCALPIHMDTLSGDLTISRL